MFSKFFGQKGDDQKTVSSSSEAKSDSKLDSFSVDNAPIAPLTNAADEGGHSLDDKVDQLR